MKICGIIAEYDPFHNGHAYHISKTKAMGADAVVVALGGQFTQRGDPAWCSKYLRAKCAVLNGADLVLEIPTPYAVGSAEKFAEGGMKVLSSLGCVDTLSFGSESGDVDLIQRFEKLEVSKEFTDLVKEELKSGISVPVARMKATEKLDKDILKIMENPNDLLAAEYIKFIDKENLNITPLAIKRFGAGHGEESSFKSGISSASYLRSFDNPEDIIPYIPSNVSDLLNDAYQNGYLPTDMKKYETLVLSILRTKTIEDIKKVPDAENEGFYNRIYDAIKKSRTLDELYDNIKTKRYTMTRVKRVVAGAVLGLDNERIKKINIPYIRVLAMNEKGCDLLKMASETSVLPVGTSLKELSEISKETESMANIESLAEDLWQICRKTPGECGKAYTEKIKKI